MATRKTTGAKSGAEAAKTARLKRAARAKVTQAKVNYGISRIDQPENRTVCWVVRMGWVRKRSGGWGAAVSKSFPDKTYGGKRKALAAARRYRDRMLRAMRRNALPARPIADRGGRDAE